MHTFVFIYIYIYVYIYIYIYASLPLCLLASCYKSVYSPSIRFPTLVACISYGDGDDWTSKPCAGVIETHASTGAPFGVALTAGDSRAMATIAASRKQFIVWR
jgi:hypothetical protein